MRTLAFLLLVAHAAWAAAQTPQEPQRQSQDAPPAPRKPLNLSLDPADQPRSRITFEPRQDKKPPAESTLPGMGGEATRAWERPSDKIYPADSNPNMR